VIDRVNVEVRRAWFDRLRTSFNGFYQKLKNDQMTEEANYTGFGVRGEYLLAKFLTCTAATNTSIATASRVAIDSFTENPAQLRRVGQLRPVATPSDPPQPSPS